MDLMQDELGQNSWGIHPFDTSLRWRKKPPSFILLKPPESWWNSTQVDGCYFCPWKDENHLMGWIWCSLNWDKIHEEFIPSTHPLQVGKKGYIFMLLPDETYSISGFISTWKPYCKDIILHHLSVLNVGPILWVSQWYSCLFLSLHLSDSLDVLLFLFLDNWGSGCYFYLRIPLIGFYLDCSHYVPLSCLHFTVTPEV